MPKTATRQKLIALLWGLCVGALIGLAYYYFSRDHGAHSKPVTPTSAIEEDDDESEDEE